MKRVQRAVITAAGRGTRQYPASSAVAKEMFPLVDRDGLTKPVIQILVEEAVAAGIERICLVTQPGDEAVYRRYFRRPEGSLREALARKPAALAAGERLQDLGERLSFVAQTAPEGYGHAVFQARDFVDDEPFLLMLGDHIYLADGAEPCAAQLVRHYAESGAAALSAVQIEAKEQLHLFGTLRGRPRASAGGLYDVEAIVEKPDEALARERLVTPGLPADHYLCHFGMHVFPPAIFEAIEHHIRGNLREGGEIQLTNAQELMRKELIDGSYAACTIAGRRYDTGIPAGLLQAQLALGLAGPHQRELLDVIEDRRPADR